MSRLDDIIAEATADAQKAKAGMFDHIVKRCLAKTTSELLRTAPVKPDHMTLWREAIVAAGGKLRQPKIGNT